MEDSNGGLELAAQSWFESCRHRSINVPGVLVVPARSDMDSGSDTLKTRFGLILDEVQLRQTLRVSLRPVYTGRSRRKTKNMFDFV